MDWLTSIEIIVLYDSIYLVEHDWVYIVYKYKEHDPLSMRERYGKKEVSMLGGVKYNGNPRT